VRKADVILGILVVVALVATAVAGLSGDRWTGERTLSFAESSQPLPPSELVPASGAGASFNWTVPDNATSANLTVMLYYSGQAFRGGTAIVSLRLTTPDGQSVPTVTRSWIIPQGATSGEMTVDVGAVWDEAPETFRDTTDEGHQRAWSRPLELVVVVERPSDVPLATYGFEASVTGTLSVFASA
jgi:hypothetical protein